MGGLFAFQLGLSAAETVLTETGIAAEGFSLKFTQLGLGLAETAKSLTSGSGKLAKTLGGVLKFVGPLEPHQDYYLIFINLGHLKP